MNGQKLPIGVQLVGATAIVVFCFTAIATYLSAQTLIHDWADVVTFPGWQTLLLAPAKSLLLALSSVAVFLALLYSSRRTAKLAANWYAVFLAIWLLVQSTFWVVSVGSWHSAIGFHAVALAIRVVYFVWLCALLFSLHPNILTIIRRR